MKNLITCLTVCVLSCATFATTWTVDVSGGADFVTIQAAINIAEHGDEIVVMQGVYFGAGGADPNVPVVDMMGKAITLRAEGIAIISGNYERQCIRCASGETSDTIIQNFYIHQGAGVYEGGGILCRPNSSPHIIGCIITDCSATYGGGITCRDNSNPLLENCKIFNNYGDGIYIEDNSNPSLMGCMIYDNENAGILLTSSGASSSVTLEDTIICNDEILVCSSCTLIDNGNNCDASSCDDDDNNDIPDECECPDINGDGEVNVNDILALISLWGTNDSDADINSDGIVDVSDLLIVIGNWGPCE